MFTWTMQYPAEWSLGLPVVVQMPPWSLLDFSLGPETSQQILEVNDTFENYDNARTPLNNNKNRR
jgi:hypothetical protein